MSKELSAVIGGYQALHREYIPYMRYPQILLTAHNSQVNREVIPSRVLRLSD